MEFLFTMYRMPAEWEPHDGTWLAWPHNREHWPGKFESIPPLYVKFIKELAQSEPVFLCVNDQVMENEARELLTAGGVDLGQITFFCIPTDASWSRDHGPIFVYGPKGRVITDWVFNAWGEKYKPWAQDDVVPQKIGKIYNEEVLEPGIVLEGGSIEVNGKGTLLTTEQCLLNKNRNPKLSRVQIEDYLNKYFGAKKVLWLPEGIVGDDTDGHIDDIARFVDERTVVAAVEKNKQDENYELLQKNFSLLQKMTDQDGQPLKVVSLPMPEPVICGGQRLPASYANFYISNKTVLVPTFRCACDAGALEILQKLFPTRRVVGIDAVDWVWGLGTVHCSTQQQPVFMTHDT